MPELPQQQARVAPTSQEQRQHLLDQLEANKKAIEELNDAEVEAVTGGFMIAGGPYSGPPGEMTARPLTAAVRPTAMPGPMISTGQANPLTAPSPCATKLLTEPPPMKPMERDNRPIV